MGTERKLTAVELFAGAGGLMLGSALAGFRHLAACEWDRACCDTIRLNQANGYPLVDTEMRIIEGDVREIDWTVFPEGVDLLAGGPPCQPFSLGGLARAHEDSRDMFPAFTAALAKLKPRAFICENVKGLVRPSFANYYSYILLRLQHPRVSIRDGEKWEEHAKRLSREHTSPDTGLFYKIVPTVVDAADYGVPQHRHRVVIVGFRSDVEASWSFPAKTHAKIAAKGLRRWRTLRDAIGDLPDPGSKADVANHDLRRGAKQYPGHTGSTLDAPAKTIKAGVHGVPGGENMMVLDDGSLRYMSVREAARVQTFPDGYEFSGSWSKGMRQVGNAVPVELARKVAASVAIALREDDMRKAVDGRFAREAAAPEAVAPRA